MAPTYECQLLVVDDEEDILESYQDLLSDLVTKMFKAKNGREAVEIIQREKIDVIISDLNMPQMSGLDLLAKVREKNSNIPFIIVTGYGDKENAVKALRLGAFDFFDKPFNVKQLRTRLSDALDSAKRLKDLQFNLVQVADALGAQKQVAVTIAAAAKSK